MKSAQTLIREALVGKKLISLEFGSNEADSPEERAFVVGSVIRSIEIMMDGYREDAKIYIELEGRDECLVQAYTNEGIIVE